MPRHGKGFTLIELLIVVAIIAILAAIAVPNFIEAQVRAKVGRTRTDLRTIAGALEAYFADNNHYPPYSSLENPSGEARWRLNHLSTPVAYITTVPTDIFTDASKDPVSWRWHLDSYIYAELARWGRGRAYHEARGRGSKWFLVSRGPNLFLDELESTGPTSETAYDPTNGTRSRGDIERFGP